MSTATAPTFATAAATPTVVSSRPAVRPSAPSEPDYRMRRVGAAVVVACSLLIATVAVSATVDAVRGLGGSPAVASETAAAAPGSYVAAPGDTLWSIAERFRGDADLVAYVDALIARNGGTAVQAGAVVVLP